VSQDTPRSYPPPKVKPPPRTEPYTRAALRAVRDILNSNKQPPDTRWQAELTALEFEYMRTGQITDPSHVRTLLRLLQLPDDLITRLLKHARRTDVSVQETIHRALLEHLEQVKKAGRSLKQPGKTP
jgi:hypothetical protein